MVREGVGDIEERSCKLAAKAVAGKSVLTLKWLSFQGVPPCRSSSMQLTNNKKNILCHYNLPQLILNNPDWFDISFQGCDSPSSTIKFSLLVELSFAKMPLKTNC